MKKQVFTDIEDHQNDWWLNTKTTIIISIIKRIFRDRSISILDVASGTGYLAQQVRGEGYPNIVTSDKLSSSLKILKKKFKKVLKISLPNSIKVKKKFDCILVLDVLEHIDDDKRSLEVIVKVLKPGGKMIITVPAWQFLWSKKDEMVEHKRRYSKKNFLELLQQSGLSIEYLSYYNFFLFFPAIIYALINKKSERMQRYNRWQDVFFRPIFLLERPIITRFMYLPWGVSLIAVVSKEKK